VPFLANCSLRKFRAVTWPDTKLIVSWLLGARDMDAALAFTHDLESRLAIASS
jgi:hypothetical protein